MRLPKIDGLDLRPSAKEHGTPVKSASTELVNEGAGFGRRLSTWGTSGAGPSDAVWRSLNTLRSRSRQLARNDSQIEGAVNVESANLVGTGITPRWKIEDSGLKKEVQALWADWIPEADYDGLLSFYGLQEMAARALIDGGEALTWFRTVPNEGLSVPLQLKLMEGDHLDENYNTVAPNGNEIRMGIEFAKSTGKRVAYWLFREHPGEYLYAKNFDRIRIPRDEIAHTFRPLRIGQQRGRPWLSSIIVPMHDLNQFNDAELVRKKTAAMFGGFITKIADPTTAIRAMGKQQDNDDEDRQVIAMEPGTFPILPDGMDVRFAEPADVGGQYEAFMKHQERRIARGIGNLTYEKFTGDLSDVNFTSIRAGNLDYQRVTKMVIYNVLAFQLCRAVANVWLDTAVLSGAIRIPDYAENRRKYQRIRWVIDGWEWVDPLKEVNAEKTAIRNGLKSRQESAASRGLDIEDVDAEIAEDNSRAASYGLVLDSNPAQDKGRAESAPEQERTGNDDRQ